MILFVPTASPAVENDAVPPLSVSVPNVFDPALNVTVPAGVPVVEDATVAVKVTNSPEVDGFAEDDRVVEVLALVTTLLSAVEVLGSKCTSPLYVAINLVVPTGSEEISKLAEPPPSVPVPSTVVPTMNDTVSPSGGAGETTAVKVTVAP